MSDSGQSYRFPKGEKLVSKKGIEELFKSGSSFYLRPLLVKYKVADDDTNKAMFSVSKRNFKRAVDRNLLKRRMREVYRLNKHLLSSDSNTFYHMAFVYVDKSIVPYDQIEPKLKKLIKRLTGQESKKDNRSETKQSGI